MCDIPGTEKGCGSQPQKLLFFTRSFSVNLILVKWVRITVYTIRERTWGNFAGFRRLSVPGEQIFRISRLFLYEFESFFLKSQKQQQHETFKNPMWFSSGMELLWRLAKENWTAAETVFFQGADKLLLWQWHSTAAWPHVQQFGCTRLSEQEALGALPSSLLNSQGFL